MWRCRPWRHHCRSRPALSAKGAQAARQAAEHLLDCDLLPLFDDDTLRALWRNGDGRLANALREVTRG